MSTFAPSTDSRYHHAQTLGGYCYVTLNEKPQAVQARGLGLELSNVVCGWATTGTTIKATARIALFNFAMCLSVANLGSGRKFTFSNSSLTSITQSNKCAKIAGQYERNML